MLFLLQTLHRLSVARPEAAADEPAQLGGEAPPSPSEHSIASVTGR